MADDTAAPNSEPIVQYEPRPEVLKMLDTTKKCSACGGTDHFRRTSKKCPHYVPKPPKNNQNDNGKKNAVPSNRSAGPSTSEISTDVVVDDTTNTNNDAVTNNLVCTTTDSENIDRDISKPTFIKLNTGTNLDNVIFKPVIDVAHPDFKPISTVFKVFGKDHRGRKRSVDAVPKVLLEKYLTRDFMMRFVESSNRYIDARRVSHPDLYCWKDTKVSSPITVSNMYHFFAMMYYFGIVEMPSKSDYWSTRQWMPLHPIVKEFGMTQRRYEFIWRHFHPSFDSVEEESLDKEEEEEESSDVVNDEDFITIGLERIQLDEENNDVSNQDEEEDQVNEDEQASNKKKVWYEKLTWIIDHVRDISKEFVFVLGTTLSLDEMMIRFYGRSLETHRMKNKPIKEGYKFFVLATKEGFILNFTPDGRTAARIGEQEYEENRHIGKIESMILFLIKVVDEIKAKQLTRLQKKKGDKIKTRKNEEDLFEDMRMDKFCLAMDNYFTLPKVICSLREANIGIVGTARFRGRTWPPKALRSVAKENVNFNDFHWMVDEYSTLISRWMDNGLVFCVSTLHKPGKIIKRKRKRPRVTQNNRAHVNKIWGDKGATDIYIPTMIDDYNYWMGGVDVADQRIAYYHPSNLVCQRNWIPIFIQLLSIIRNNAFLVHSKSMGKKASSHKVFCQDIISWFMLRARQERISAGGRLKSTGVVESLDSKEDTTKPVHKKQKIKGSTWALNELTNRFPSRFLTPKELHGRTSVGRGTCVYCSASYLDRKKKGEKKLKFDRETKRTFLHCSFCTLTSADKSTCYLCKEHFDKFHTN